MQVNIVDGSFVALYTSAWIEIEDYNSLEVKGLCRTLHECVD